MRHWTKMPKQNANCNLKGTNKSPMLFKHPVLAILLLLVWFVFAINLCRSFFSLAGSEFFFLLIRVTFSGFSGWLSE